MVIEAGAFIVYRPPRPVNGGVPGPKYPGLNEASISHRPTSTPSRPATQAVRQGLRPGCRAPLDRVVRSCSSSCASLEPRFGHTADHKVRMGHPEGPIPHPSSGPVAGPSAESHVTTVTLQSDPHQPRNVLRSSWQERTGMAADQLDDARPVEGSPVQIRPSRRGSERLIRNLGLAFCGPGDQDRGPRERPDAP